MTQRDKAMRYDALVCAIKYHIEKWREHADEMEESFEDVNNLTFVECMDYGQVVAFRYVVKELEKMV